MLLVASTVALDKLIFFSDCCSCCYDYVICCILLDTTSSVVSFWIPVSLIHCVFVYTFWIFGKLIRRLKTIVVLSNAASETIVVNLQLCMIVFC